MPIINYRKLLVRIAWVSAGIGVYKIGKEFVQDGYLSFVGSIFLLNSFYAFYLTSKMKVRKDNETELEEGFVQDGCLSFVGYMFLMFLLIIFYTFYFVSTMENITDHKPQSTDPIPK